MSERNPQSIVSDARGHNHRRPGRRWWAMACVFVATTVFAAAANSAWFGKETPGDRFRKAMKTREQWCAAQKLLPGETSCDILKLKPADPMASREGRFAHSIKLPDQRSTAVFKKGMTSEQYFEALCAAEAGEFIYKSVKGVDGILQMRPREEASDQMLMHLYAMEDPYGYIRGEVVEPEFMFVSPTRYRFFEMPLVKVKVYSVSEEMIAKYRHASYSTSAVSESRYATYAGYDTRDWKTMVKDYRPTRSARYGYTWRGISRPNDRELGIAGGELIVLDLDTNEVLGFRRGFTKTSHIKNNATSIGWEFAAACPAYEGGTNKTHDFAYWFLSKVLEPTSPTHDVSFQRRVIQSRK